MDESQIQKTISDMVNFTIYSMRTPLQHFPDEVGLQYEDVFFPAMDGVILEGWFIPADSDKVIIETQKYFNTEYNSIAIPDISITINENILLIEAVSKSESYTFRFKKA